MGDAAACDVDGVQEGRSVRVGPGAGRVLSDQAAYGVVGQHQALEFLEYESRSLAAQQGSGSKQMGLSPSLAFSATSRVESEV